MALQSDRIDNTQRIQNKQSTPSYKQTLSLIAQNRIQHIWITFIDGVKSLYEFAVGLNKPGFESHRLEYLSKNAQEKIKLAEQDIKSGENDIKDEINRLVLLRQEYEQDLKDLKNKIKALSQKSITEQREAEIATDEVKNAERQVTVYTNMECNALVIHELATRCAFLLTRKTSRTIGPTVGMWVYKFGIFITAVTNSILEKSRKAVEERRVKLSERINKLIERKTALYQINEERNQMKIKFDNLILSHEKLLDFSKLLTKLKSCKVQCHDFINITLGRVGILNERRKSEILRGNLTHIIEELVEHISCVQSFEDHFPILQQLKSLTHQMKSKCIKPSSNDDKDKGCDFINCSKGILSSLIQYLFRLRTFDFNM